MFLARKLTALVSAKNALFNEATDSLDFKESVDEGFALNAT